MLEEEAAETMYWKDASYIERNDGCGRLHVECERPQLGKCIGKGERL